MAKKKQHKQTKWQKSKSTKSEQHKEEMKDVLKQLAQTRKRNQSSPKMLMSVTQINCRKKRIKKLQKTNKHADRKEEPEEEPRPSEEAPKVNIFSVDQFVTAQKPMNLQSITVEKPQTEDLQSMAIKAMGGDITLEKFGEKPFKKIIDEDEDKGMLSEEENEPNSLKKVSHPNLKIPEGNHVVTRTNNIQEFRKKLPIYMKEQEVIETINQNLVTLICGETGSGKSTQIPQFLMQKNYQRLGLIGITQPRRLATISLASRVAEQMKSKLGAEVGFQVRHEAKQSKSTVVKFMTDGILLNEMNSDFMLHKYAVIVLDEAHERKLNTDILIGLLSRVILMRYELSQQGKCQPLRLVIMSATMRVEDFQNTDLFSFHVPIVKVEARMFPVTTFHEKNTPEDYVQAAVAKCIKIHRQLPEGDVLVFLTGKEEIHEMCVKLQAKLEEKSWKHQNSDEQSEMNEEPLQGHTKMEGFVICKLYSSLPMQEQRQAFRKMDNGIRKFVISTNVAQTSITIPNIRYVVDSGHEKHRYFEGVWKWKKGWGSKAMAEQRTGRAGRTTHGYCYRLYSNSVYANLMDMYAAPEITLQPLENVLLQLKTIGISNVYKFPFPTKPPEGSILTALQSLLQIQAIEGHFTQQEQDTKATQLGTALSFIPLKPKLSKMLLQGRKADLAQYMLYIVLLLTVEDIFSEIANKNSDLAVKAQRKELKSRYHQYQKYEHLGEIFTSMNVIGEFLMKLSKVKAQNSIDNFGISSQSIISVISQISNEMLLNSNCMRQLYLNADQICEIYETLSESKIDLSRYEAPSEEQIHHLLDILLSNHLQNVCYFQQKNQYVDVNGKAIFVVDAISAKKHLFMCSLERYQLENGKSYTRYPFAVTNYELLASFGTVNQPTDFAIKEGRLVALTNGTIYGWEIPKLVIEDPVSQSRYVFMARFILQGKVVPAFKVLQKYYVAPTSTVHLGNMDYRVQKLIETVTVNNITTRDQLVSKFNHTSHFMKQDLKNWLKVADFEKVYKQLRRSILP